MAEVSRTELLEVFDGKEIAIVGVTLEPDTGRLIVLDANSGLYVLGESGALTQLADLSMMIPQDTPLWSQFTDVVALGNGKFAMTAMNDGFLLDLERETFTQYFCYVPGDIIVEFPEGVQMTRSVTYDPATQTLYAQPQTFLDGSMSEPVLSQVGQFDIEGGEGYGWVDMPALDFIAGGIAVRNSDELLLGEGATVHRYIMSQEQIVEEIDLSDFGVQQIDAMAMVPQTNTLWVVDGVSQSLIEIALNL